MGSKVLPENEQGFTGAKSREEEPSLGMGLRGT